MVVGFPTASGRTEAQRSDMVFHALADVTRRDIVRRCLHVEHSVSALARQYPMSFAAVQKHVAALEAAGLVVKRRNGREQLVSTDIEALRAVRRALDQLEGLWRARVERMGDLLARQPTERHAEPHTERDSQPHTERDTEQHTDRRGERT